MYKKSTVVPGFSKVGRKWTPEELETLKQLYKVEKLSIIDIARQMERLPRGIVFQLKSLKIIENDNKARGFSEESMQEMLDEYKSAKRECNVNDDTLQNQDNTLQKSDNKKAKMQTGEQLDVKLDALNEKLNYIVGNTDKLTEEIALLQNQIHKLNKHFNAVVNALEHLHNKVDAIRK